MKRFLVVLSCAFLLLSLGLANAGNLEEVQKAIKQKGAKWAAGENSVSRLPLEQLKKRLGTIIERKNLRGEIPSVVGLPTSFDWRDQGMVTPVKDQGNCGSCWAFGSVAGLESQLLLAGTTPNPDFSEQFVVSCNKTNSGCDGGYMSRVYNFLARGGTPEEACFPYQAKDLPCLRACREWQETQEQISSWSWVTRNVDALKAAVYENPVPAAFVVYEDFMYYTGGVYEHVSGGVAGGHAILIVGWDDNPPEGIPCFIVKNSWDTNWGEAGYFRIGYSQVTNEVEFGDDAGDFEM